MLAPGDWQAGFLTRSLLQISVADTGGLWMLASAGVCTSPTTALGACKKQSCVVQGVTDKVVSRYTSDWGRQHRLQL